MLVGIQKEIGVLEAHGRVRRVDITLENGQHFILNEHSGALSVHVDGQLIVLPRVSNVVLLKEEA